LFFLCLYNSCPINKPTREREEQQRTNKQASKQTNKTNKQTKQTNKQTKFV